MVATVFDQPIDDPGDLRRRIERFAARIDRRDDYGRLLARGDVIRPLAELEDPDAWRAELRRQAKADKLKIRTGTTSQIAYAVLPESDTPARAEETVRYGRMLRHIVPLATALGHEPVIGERDGDEAIFMCDRCQALAYGDAANEMAGGSLTQERCPHPSPPKPTALTLFIRSST